MKKIYNKVLIIGDSIIDQYDYVQPLNKPIKESILATKFKKQIFLGGVYAAATNLSQFNNNITVCTVIGKDINLKIKKFKKRLKVKFSLKRIK